MREPLPLLLDAIERDNDGFVLRLLNDPGLLGRIGGINKVDKDGCTALMNAIFKGKTDIAEKILSIEGIDITLTNNEGQTALMYASHFGNEEIVHALLLKLLSDQDKGLAKEIDRKDKQGDTALMMAVAMNHQNIIKLLLSKNSDINKENNAGVTPLIQAVFKSNREVLKILLDYEEIEISKYDKCHERGQTALQYAVLSEREDSKIVELILDSKKAHSIKDEDLHVALTVAIGLQYEKIIEKLCCFFNENNSNIINLVSHTGKTALMHAIQSGNTEIVKRLLSVKGIDINQMDTEGLTALSYVAQLQDHSKAQMIAEMLLSKREINIHLADHNGCIPLMHFADRGHCRIVEKLIKLMIQQEGDINCYDKEKNTALVRAIKGSHLYTVRALLPYSNPNIPANPYISRDFFYSSK